MARATAVIIAPATTDDLPEGSTNKYDTGAPPADLEELPDGTTRKAMLDTEKTKLTGIEESADVNPTGSEMQTALDGLPDAEKKIIMSEPETGEHKIYGIHRNAAGQPEYEYEDQAES